MIYAIYRKFLGTNVDNTIRKIQLWAETHNMIIDEYMSEESAPRSKATNESVFLKVLLPRLYDGDIVIFSELSSIGRSASELDEILNHTIKKSIRIICIPVDMDIDYSNISPSNRNLLDKFSFAAKLHSFLSHEVTLIALASKKEQGKLLGAKSSKWQEAYRNKTKEQKNKENIKKGKTRHERYMLNHDTQAFLKVIKNVFPDECKSTDARKWNWSSINTKGEYKERIMCLMEKYKEKEKKVKLFDKWDFEGEDRTILIARLRAYLSNMRNSVLKYYVEEKSAPIKIIKKKRIVKHLKETTQNNYQINKTIFDEQQLKKIEQDTKLSHEILSNIFVDKSADLPHSSKNSLTREIRNILLTLLSKEIWTYKEVESICHQYNLMTNSVLETINDYSFSCVEDAVVSEDDDEIHVVTDYKHFLV